MPNFEGIITVDQLRSEIGSPTADVRDPVAVTDEELHNIITRNEKILDQTILARLEKRALESVPASDQKAHEKAQISLTDEGTHAEGKVESRFYPVTFYQATSNNQFYEYDPNLQAESTGFFDRRRFRFSGRRILVIPSDTDPITMRLPVKVKVRRRMGDLVAKANNKIIQRAVKMVEAKRSEGLRLEEEDIDQ